MHYNETNFRRPQKRRVQLVHDVSKKMKQLIREAYSWEHNGELRETERVERDPFEFEEDEEIEL